MKQRNFVAKYSQRSGAGKHKRKDRLMSTVDKEDWIHVDDFWNRVGYLEEQIQDLKLTIKSMEEDEVYFLSQLIELRWRYSDYEDMHEELTYLIKLHKKIALQKALQLLEKEYPSTPIESWGCNV